MMINHRRAVPTLAERDRRQEAWAAAPSIAERFPSTGRFAIDLSFRDPSGAAQPSPMRQIYEPSMRAHFELACPVRDCAGGGFELQRPVMAMLGNPRLPQSGVMCCEGSRREGGTCGLELSYAISRTDSNNSPI